MFISTRIKTLELIKFIHIMLNNKNMKNETFQSNEMIKNSKFYSKEIVSLRNEKTLIAE
jgi:hypothetical protein